MTLIWFTISSLGVPVVYADCKGAPDAHGSEGQHPSIVVQLGIADESVDVPADELCVSPELVATPKPPAGCGCSLRLQKSGRCCCLAMQTPAARSCCATKTEPGSEAPASADVGAEQNRQGDGPPKGAIRLTCPCGSGPGAWVAVAAEPRVLGGAAVVVPGRVPVETIATTAPRLPQVFLAPETPPPKRVG